MLDRQSFLAQYPAFTDGMAVCSLDGEKLGKVTEISDNAFTVEKGLFFPKDFSARFDDIEEIRDGVIYLRHPEANFQPWREEGYEGWNEVNSMNTENMSAKNINNSLNDSLNSDNRGNLSGNISEETKVPVSEEELEAHKTMRETGQVRIHKTVHTEYKHFTVPVLKEEVRVERLKADTLGSLNSAEIKGDETVTIPVREEELEITKRPVMKEEIRVSKTARVEQKEVGGEVRKEDVEIEGMTEEERRLRKAA